MEVRHIGAVSIIGMVLTLVISTALPILLMVWARLKKQAKISTFFISGIAYVLFGLIMERILTFITVLIMGTEWTENIWLFALFCGMIFAFCSEIGRWVATRFFLDECMDMPNAFMCGVGYGTVEVICSVWWNSINYIVLAVMVNRGMADIIELYMTDAAAREFEDNLAVFCGLPAYCFYVHGVECIVDIVLSIALSILMYVAVDTKKIWIGLLAFVAHFFVYAASMFGYNLSMGVVSGIMALFTAGTVGMTIILYKRYMKW